MWVSSLATRICLYVGQRLIKDQEAVAKEIKEEVDAHQRRVDLEDHLVQRLMDIEREEKQKAQIVR